MKQLIKTSASILLSASLIFAASSVPAAYASTNKEKNEASSAVQVKEVKTLFGKSNEFSKYDPLRKSQVRIDRVSKNVIVPFNRVNVNEKSLEVGKKAVRVAGINGIMTQTLRVLIQGDEVISTTVLNQKVAKPVVNEVVLVGTKEVQPIQLKAKEEAPKAPKVEKKAEPKKEVKKAKKVVKKVQPKKAVKAKKVVKKSPVRKSNNKTFRLSFYTNLPSENGGWTITASGKSLRRGMCASNYYPIGTKIYLSGYGTVTVEDRGGSDFNSSSRLDIFIPRRSGESSSQYYRRVNNMGKPTTSGRVL